MKRLFLGSAAVLLLCGALASKPVGACPINQTCNPVLCNNSCIAKGDDSGSCTGACGLCKCLF